MPAPARPSTHQPLPCTYSRTPEIRRRGCCACARPQGRMSSSSWSASPSLPGPRRRRRSTPTRGRPSSPGRRRSRPITRPNCFRRHFKLGARQPRRPTALGTWHLALGTWHLALGTWHLAKLASSLVNGARACGLPRMPAPSTCQIAAKIPCRLPPKVTTPVAAEVPLRTTIWDGWGWWGRPCVRWGGCRELGRMRSIGITGVCAGGGTGSRAESWDRAGSPGTGAGRSSAGNGTDGRCVGYVAE